MNFWKLLAILALVLFPAVAQAGRPAQLIYLGWDSPGLDQLAQIAARLKDSPFDGIGVYPRGHEKIFRTSAFPEDDYLKDFSQVAIIKPEYLGHSYLVVYSVTDKTFDWTNDAHWQATLSNAAMIARLAKRGGFKGLIFDPEDYGSEMWLPRAQMARHKASFGEMQQVLERRGETLMKALEAEYPGIEILFTLGLSANIGAAPKLAQKMPVADILRDDIYGLWPSFFGGMVKAASSQSLLIEGNERCYGCYRQSDFAKQRKTYAADLVPLLPEGAKTAYGKVEIGQAVYADSLLNSGGTPWYVGYYLANDEGRQQALAATVGLALANADGYAWYYAEKAGYWSQPSLKVDQAIRKGKAAAKAGQAGDDERLSKALGAFQMRRAIRGRFIAGSGKVPQGISFADPLAAKTCKILDAEGNYLCIFPNGSSVSLQPKLSNNVFDPPQRSFPNLKNHLAGVDFKILPGK